MRVSETGNEKDLNVFKNNASLIDNPFVWVTGLYFSLKVRIEQHFAAGMRIPGTGNARYVLTGKDHEISAETASLYCGALTLHPNAELADKTFCETVLNSDLQPLSPEDVRKGLGRIDFDVYGAIHFQSTQGQNLPESFFNVERLPQGERSYYLCHMNAQVMEKMNNNGVVL